jgi:hypothetical protein
VSSYKPEVQVFDEPAWVGNTYRFATTKEASVYLIDLLRRWAAVQKVRIIPSGDPVNCRWDEELGSVCLAQPNGLVPDVQQPARQGSQEPRQ